MVALQPFTDWLRAHHARGLVAQIAAGYSPTRVQQSCLDAADLMILEIEASHDVYVGWLYDGFSEYHAVDNALISGVLTGTETPQLKMLEPHLKL
jgi:hypothetical protein